MRVLGIESSCDETAAAVVTADGTVLSDVVRSQIALHAPYGGVVPEIAARDHLDSVIPVVTEALVRADMDLRGVDAIAVTCRPGLIGSLLVGVQAAKGMAWATGKPIVGVDHLIGHLLAVFLRRPPPSEQGGGPPAVANEGWSETKPSRVTAGAVRDAVTTTSPTAESRTTAADASGDVSGRPADGPYPQFPFVGLVVSGGHTALYHCRGHRPEEIEELGATRDDAVGEAYDKVAKLLGLGYPGGPVVDRLAAEGRPEAARVRLAAPMSKMSNRTSFEFSFSGLKSAIARHVASPEAPRSEQDRRDLCAAFQQAVCRTLVTKTLRAAAEVGIGRVVVAGGVAANRGLRARMAAACARRGIELHVPPLVHCTDNAAMVAYAGALRFAAGERDGYDLGPRTVASLPRRTRKGRGRR